MTIKRREFLAGSKAVAVACPRRPITTGSLRAESAWALVWMVAVWLIFLFGTSVAMTAERSLPRPNIVLILADDLGWADLGCYGADLHETPNLDRLAGRSVRFTNAYAMPVCSPTRAALLTGRHAARVHMTIWSEGSLQGPRNRKLLQADSLPSLPHTETTLAKHLQDAGYLTALVGKWHLGDADHYPETHGFDVNIGGTRWAHHRRFGGRIEGPDGSVRNTAMCPTWSSANLVSI